MTSPRPAEHVMSMRRAAGAVANALSFSRSAMRELAAGRWRILKDRFDLDEEGRGEILYRLVSGRWTYHFFLISLKLDDAQKMDRNWAQSWDAMGVLCEGEWTPEREALLRREVPKQRSGFAEYDTLVYARGNRSGRLFDEVVESLASGRQPDAAKLARVGYILRTTAFIANGQLGTRAYAGFDPDSPLRRPYHAQMASAFVLREYMFDLVDHIARCRSKSAVRLDARYRRYLGLGNAAATGLVPFLANHPVLMHRWTLAIERALAAAAAKPATSAALTGFSRLLEKAIRYLREADQPGSGNFIAGSMCADDLARLHARLAEFGDRSFAAIIEWAAQNLATEAAEMVNAIVLELAPDAIAAARDAFDGEERFEADPATTIGALRTIVERDYGWALAPEPDAARFFWYRSAQAPRDLRRGIRGLVPELEAETAMETPVQVRALWSVLDGDPQERVADLLARRPDLRHIIARVQTLAGCAYAELRTNWGTASLSPFPPVRFVLAFYGMEKFEAVHPKQVRGAFMQGAPIAEDIEEGIELSDDPVSWPYPLTPRSTEPYRAPRSVLPPPGLGALTTAEKARSAPPVDRDDDIVRVAPSELARMIHTALQGHGLALGVAEEIGRIAMVAHGRGRPAIAAVLALCNDGLPESARAVEIRAPAGSANIEIDAHDASALLAAPIALDLACARARTLGRAEVSITRTRDTGLLDGLIQHAAERGLDARASHTATSYSLELDAGRSPTPPANLAGWHRHGLPIRRGDFDALNRALARLWVPVDIEPRLRPDVGVDALKIF